jgi:hypothetical protein
MNSDNKDKFLECEQTAKWTDATLREHIKENYGSEIRDTTIEARNKLIERYMKGLV